MVLAGGLGIFFAGAGVFRRPQGGRREPRATKFSLARIKSDLTAVSAAAARGTLAGARIISATAGPHTCEASSPAPAVRGRPRPTARPHHARAHSRDGFQHVRGIFLFIISTDIVVVARHEGVHVHGGVGGGVDQCAVVVEPRH